MNAAEANPAAAQTGSANLQPDLAIRARPPSPRRLSRKVLLGGAFALAAIVATALVYGLSATPKAHVRETQAQVNIGDPPESISAAPSDYASDDLRHGFDDEGEGDAGLNEPALQPPADTAWAGEGGVQAARAPQVNEPGPQELARAAPVLFEPQASQQNRARANISDVDADRLQSYLAPPRSRYEVMAGSVIAASLLTELNSDAAGRVIAQVTAPVFDSVTGVHLLIPQGSRLIGAYDNGVAYGDRRLVLVWRRLILPNGWSLNLQDMEGTDPAGAAGLRDRIDNHLDRLIGAVALSAIIGVVANTAEDDDEEDVSVSQNLGDAAAQEAARSGARIVERELSVRPTLRIRVGAPVRVLVTRDIALRPYRELGNGNR